MEKRSLSPQRTADEVRADIARINSAVIIAHGRTALVAVISRTLKLVDLRAELAAIERTQDDHDR